MEPIQVIPEKTDEFLEANKDKLVVVVFNAEFTNQQDIVTSVIDKLKDKKASTIDYVLAVADAEDNHQFATKLSVVSLPCIAILAKGKLVKKIIDFEPERVFNQLENELTSYSKLSPETLANPKERLNNYLQQLINKAPVMIFMKGEPSAPRCGFSKQLVEILSRNNVIYNSFNILEDEEVRQGLKELSNWPTYPQIYAGGEFIGGLDILKQLEEANELREALGMDKNDA